MPIGEETVQPTLNVAGVKGDPFKSQRFAVPELNGIVTRVPVEVIATLLALAAVVAKNVPVGVYLLGKPAPELSAHQMFPSVSKDPANRSVDPVNVYVVA
jgi:hypothetical protein